MKSKQSLQISIQNRSLEFFPIVIASWTPNFLNADEHQSKKQPPRPARQIECLHLLFPHRNHSLSKNQTLLGCLKWDTQQPGYLKPLDIL